MNGVNKLGMSVNEKTWMKFADDKIKLVGRRIWMNKCSNSDRLQEYAFKKQLHMIDKYVDRSVGAMVGMMVRGGCLPVRGNTGMSWKHDDEHCMCGEEESKEHVLLDCNLYMDVRRRFKEKLATVNEMQGTKRVLVTHKIRVCNCSGRVPKSVHWSVIWSAKTVHNILGTLETPDLAVIFCDDRVYLYSINTFRDKENV